VLVLEHATASEILDLTSKQSTTMTVECAVGLVLGARYKLAADRNRF